jgi:hypothetical protein
MQVDDGSTAAPEGENIISRLSYEYFKEKPCIFPYILPRIELPAFIISLVSHFLLVRSIPPAMFSD